MNVLKTTGGASSFLLRVLLLAAVALAPAACVRTTTGVFTENASPEKALEERVSLARRYIGEGNWEDAKRNLELAAEIDPNNAEVHEAFALVYQSTGEYELAEESFKEAIRMDSGLSRARNNYAAFLAGQERYKEAEKQLRYVVKDTLYEARPNAFFNLGLCQVQLGEKASAAESFERAIAMDRVHRGAMLELSHLLYDEGRNREAKQYYDGYRRLTRQQSPRALLLGIRLAQATGDKDAEASYSLALGNLYPNSAEYEEYVQGGN